MGISEYKNDPQKLMAAKMKKIMHFESFGPLIETLNKETSVNKFFKEVNRQDERKEYLVNSLFRDIISFEMAKKIANDTRIPTNKLFRLIRAAIPLEISKKMLEKHTIKTKNGDTLFALQPNLEEKLVKIFRDQLIENKKPRLPENII